MILGIRRANGPADAPLPAWARGRVGTATPRPGTRAALAIETNVLGPLERTGRVGAALARAARKCAGCKTDAARLDGDGTRGSAI